MFRTRVVLDASELTTRNGRRPNLHDIGVRHSQSVLWKIDEAAAEWSGDWIVCENRVPLIVVAVGAGLLPLLDRIFDSSLASFCVEPFRDVLESRVSLMYTHSVDFVGTTRDYSEKNE